MNYSLEKPIEALVESPCGFTHLDFDIVAEKNERGGLDFVRVECLHVMKICDETGTVKAIEFRDLMHSHRQSDLENISGLINVWIKHYSREFLDQQEQQDEFLFE